MADVTMADVPNEDIKMMSFEQALEALYRLKALN